MNNEQDKLKNLTIEMENLSLESINSPKLAKLPELVAKLDQELQRMEFKLKEWYSWHFPELLKIVTERAMYVKVVATIKVKLSGRCFKK